MSDHNLSSPHLTYQIGALSVQIYSSSSQLVQAATAIAYKYINSLLAQQQTVRLILATGDSQIQFLDALIDRQDLDWSRVILFHLDEYLGIEANHPGSFRYYLREKVEKRVKNCQFHYLQGDALQPLKECDRYSQLLQQQPIDLCLLGIGQNGHLAFNEPSVADFNDPHLVKLVRLEEKTRQQQVDSGYFPNLKAVPQYAYTLTIPTICAAKKIICLVLGKHKAKIIQTMLEENVSSACPASILRQQSQATLFLDEDAALSLIASF